MSPATLSRRVGQRVVIVTHSGLVFGAAGRLTVLSVDEAGGVTLALPKGAPAAYIRARDIRTVRAFPEEVSQSTRS